MLTISFFHTAFQYSGTYLLEFQLPPQNHLYVCCVIQLSRQPRISLICLFGQFTSSAIHYSESAILRVLNPAISSVQYLPYLTDLGIYI